MNKYYTPELSEFKIGFEFESLNSQKWFFSESSFKWIKKEYNIYDSVRDFSLDNLEHAICKEWIRVKYLTSDDIISLGYYQSKLHSHIYIRNEQIDYLDRGQKMTVGINFNEGLTHVLIFVVPNEKTIPEGINCFVGKIKNKFELKEELKRIYL